MINICYGKEHLTEEEVKNYVEEFKDIKIEIMYNIGYEDGYDDCLMEGYEEEEEEEW